MTRSLARRCTGQDLEEAEAGWYYGVLRGITGCFPAGINVMSAPLCTCVSSEITRSIHASSNPFLHESMLHYSRREPGLTGNVGLQNVSSDSTILSRTCHGEYVRAPPSCPRFVLSVCCRSGGFVDRCSCGVFMDYHSIYICKYKRPWVCVN